MRAREHYLEALGIDLWVPRAAPAEAPETATRDSITRDTVAPSTTDAGSVDATDSDAIWSGLQAQVAGCTRCGLCQTRTQTVFGVGERQSQLLVIGEAPGQDEDAQGEPFVGRAGQLLNSMLRAMGYPRETVYIANVIKCRPPGNRDPTPAEVASCLPYLNRQIELIAPKMILVVGRIAAQNLLATEVPVGRLRGQVHRYGARGTPLIVTYHPAYLLRSPGEKRKVWADLKFARAQLARAG